MIQSDDVLDTLLDGGREMTDAELSREHGGASIQQIHDALRDLMRRGDVTARLASPHIVTYCACGR